MKKTFTLLTFLLTLAYTFAQGGFSYSGGYTVHQTTYTAGTGVDYGAYGYGTSAVPCDMPMHPADFERAFAAIDAEPFSSDKLAMARHIVSFNILKSEQIARIVDDLAFSSDREEFAKAAWFRVCDPQNYYLVLSAFTFSCPKTNLQAHMAANPRGAGVCCACDQPTPVPTTCGGPGVCDGCGMCASVTPPAPTTCGGPSVCSGCSVCSFGGGFDVDGAVASGGSCGASASTGGGFSYSGGYSTGSYGGYSSTGTGNYYSGSSHTGHGHAGHGHSGQGHHNGDPNAGGNGNHYGPSGGPVHGQPITGSTKPSITISEAPKPRPRPAVKPSASNPAEFGRILNLIKSQSSEAQKLNIAKNYAKKNVMRTTEIRRIMQSLSQESSKLAFAKFAYRSCSDKNNFLSLTNEFRFESSKRSLRAFVQGA